VLGPGLHYPTCMSSQRVCGVQVFTCSKHTWESGGPWTKKTVRGVEQAPGLAIDRAPWKPLCVWNWELNWIGSAGMCRHRARLWSFSSSPRVCATGAMQGRCGERFSVRRSSAQGIIWGREFVSVDDVLSVVAINPGASVAMYCASPRTGGVYKHGRQPRANDLIR
jgi:hypothetical protein